MYIVFDVKCEYFLILWLDFENQPSSKLLLSLFLFKLLRKEIFVNESHINLLFLSLGPVPKDSMLCL